MLAALALTPGQPVPTEILIDRVWDGNPPNKARDNLYTKVTRLRARLQEIGADAQVSSRGGSYILETDPENVDYYRFRQLRVQARAIAESGDEQEAVRLLNMAAELWRGEPLAGLSGSWVDRTRKGIEDELLGGAVERIEFELQLGRHADMVTELSALADGYPYHEKLVELLMTALYRSGRQVEAQDVYRRTRQHLVTGYASEAGPQLRELHQRILRGDASLLLSPGMGRARNNLPRDTSTFTGRTGEIARLLAMATPHETAVTVLAIDGMPGVGKSALAVHLAHRLAGRYPDGQLHLDLYGHDTERAPLDPLAALDQLLRMLGIPAARIPPGLDERATLWRAELARRKALIVLDGAAGHEQIRHLLPGTPGCLVLITSRRRLAGLDDIQSLSLEALPPEDAATLFGRIIGHGRARETDEVATLMRLCGYLPMAIQLVGNRIQHRSSWQVADLVALLGDNNRRLAEIRADNREITAAFELSYQGLDPVRQEAFRLFGLHPGAEFGIDSSAALLQADLHTTERILDDLLDHHLIAEPRRGRYQFHDLIRDYARQLSADRPDLQRRVARSRLLDFYLFTADRADQLLHPRRVGLPIEVSGPPPALPRLETAEDARNWFTGEVDNLLHLSAYAADDRWPKHAALLAHVLSQFLETSGHWKEAVGLHQRAIDAWRLLGDQAGAARARADIARMLSRAGNQDNAFEQATQALTIQRGLNDQHAIADLLDLIGVIYIYRSEYTIALEYCELALQTQRALGDRRGEAASLSHLGIALWHLGDYPEGDSRMRQSLAIWQEIDDPRGKQITLNNLGDFELQLGRAASALQYYEQATAADPEMGPQHQAICFNNIANVRQDMGDLAEANQYYRNAVKLYQEIGDRRGEADALNNIGSCYVRMGRDNEAFIHFQKARNIAVEISERFIESQALRQIAGVHQRAARHDIALDGYGKALELARAIGDLYQQARTLDQMGFSLLNTGNAGRSEECWQQALALYDQLGVPEAEDVRARLGAAHAPDRTDSTA
ncbi:SARP family transcriptional regulator [Acrocarpospora pleiomorpha]|uniref:SARP family transcriptional regulator n=1 Tax=Acrocarpospora pleiomorpha TaxID=90975 RepID=A0A5M3XZ29_9ACTN|nr:tetratricopeptide repeat protein [Acrocarpospora pleiomorpha]GES26377.1 SARP family transcriptional regulator [Acrocarpospora pleiomorpha]